MNKKLIDIPSEYDTIGEKIQYLKQLSALEKIRDRMDMNYSYQLYLTKEYYKLLDNISNLREDKINSILDEKN